MDRVNLFVIGVNKCGTNWLNHFLAQHPDVFMSKVKELNFFNDREPSPATIEEYHSHFPFEEDYQYFGEASARYYEDEKVADKLKRYSPEAKLLAIVRDPIDRLVSQYRYHKQLGMLTENTTIEEALDGRDPALTRDSHYENTLPAFTERFDSDQFQIVSLEEERGRPEAFWDRLISFLDLSYLPCPDPDPSPENPTGSAAYRRVYPATIRPIKSYAPSLYRRMLESDLVRQTKLGLIRLLGTAEPETLSSEQEERLRDEFAPTYAYLKELGFDVYDAG